MDAGAPRVSLVLPAFNHLAFLPKAVATALNQTLMDFELIIVNDGSTDGTRQWLADLRHPRVRIIHQDNRGPAAAINTGIRAARGEYLSWISADNYCAPYFVEAFVAALDAQPSSAMAYSPFYTVGADDRIDGIKFDNLLLLRELVTNRPRGMAGFMYRKSMHDVTGMYEGWACDTLMWSRVMENFSAVFVLEPTYFYRFHDARATVVQAAKVLDAVNRITAGFLERHQGALGADPLARLYPGVKQAPHLAAYAQSDFARGLFRCGFKTEALALLGVALATAAPGAILRPLLNAVGVCLMSGVDPARFVADALAGNAALSRVAVDAGVDVADAVAVMVAAGDGVDLLGMETNSMLLALEKPLVFSFTAWKHDPALVPVRGI